VAPQPHAQRAQRRADARGRRLSVAAAGLLPPPGEQLAAEERARREHHRGREHAAAVLELDSGDGLAVLGLHEANGLAAEHGHALVAEHAPAHDVVVGVAVALRARRAHRRPLAGVEHPELDAGLVRDDAHLPAERVDLTHQLPLGEAADRGVARHAPDGRRVQHDHRRARARAGRGGHCLYAGVAAADHDHVEVTRHGGLHT
jgi:hypothetical protein